MSFRRPEGAMGRPELFQAEKRCFESTRSEPLLSESKDDDEPLQLEHMMGYSGRHLNSGCLNKR